MPWSAGELVYSGGAVAEGHSTGSGCAGDGDELTAQQRAVRVTARLMAGERLRTRDVMRICGIRWSGAYKLMGHISMEIPLFVDDEGFWMVMRDG
jgi:hypothetical protein